MSTIYVKVFAKNAILQDQLLSVVQFFPNFMYYQRFRVILLTNVKKSSKLYDKGKKQASFFFFF